MIVEIRASRPCIHVQLLPPAFSTSVRVHRRRTHHGLVQSPHIAHHNIPDDIDPERSLITPSLYLLLSFHWTPSTRSWICILSFGSNRTTNINLEYSLSLSKTRNMPSYSIISLISCITLLQILSILPSRGQNFTQNSSSFSSALLLHRSKRQYLDGPDPFHSLGGVNEDGQARAPLVLEVTHNLTIFNGPMGRCGVCARTYRVLKDLQYKPSVECQRYENSRQAALGDLTEFYHTVSISSLHFHISYVYFAFLCKNIHLVTFIRVYWV